MISHILKRAETSLYFHTVVRCSLIALLEDYLGGSIQVFGEFRDPSEPARTAWISIGIAIDIDL
jgi:hypothetical protein